MDENNLPAPEPAVFDRRERVERRQGERRKKNVPVAVERRSGAERRTGERRRQVDPTTCERDYSGDEIEFMRAMDLYKRMNNRLFPTWSEVLEVIRALGYRKVAEAGQIPGVPADMLKPIVESSQASADQTPK
jgi:hypothetical protein